MRTCEHCETLIISGWINEECEEYFCSTDCLEVYHPDYSNLTEGIYFTDWDVYSFDGVQYASEDDAIFTAYNTGFNCTDVTAAKYDVNKSLYRLDNGQLTEINLENIAV